MTVPISQFIAHLQAQQAAHGDLPVYRPTNEGWRVSPVRLEFTEAVTHDDPELNDDSDGNPLPSPYLVVG